MKKFIILAIAVVIVLGAGGALVFSLNKNTESSKASASDDSSTTKSDSNTENEDQGACSMVDVATITSALGSAADTLGNAQDTGVTSLGDGDMGQTCIYPFVADATISNSFYIDIASYATQATFDDVAQYSSDGTTVDVGDVAYFTVATPITSNSTEYTLTVHKDKKIIKFVISQPTSTTTFTNDTAQSALTTIGKAAKL